MLLAVLSRQYASACSGYDPRRRRYDLRGVVLLGWWGSSGPPRLQRIPLGRPRTSRDVRAGSGPHLSPGLGSPHPIRRRLCPVPRRRGSQAAGAFGTQHGRILRPSCRCLREADHRGDRELTPAGPQADVRGTLCESPSYGERALWHEPIARQSRRVWSCSRRRRYPAQGRAPQASREP